MRGVAWRGAARRSACDTLTSLSVIGLSGGGARFFGVESTMPSWASGKKEERKGNFLKFRPDLSFSAAGCCRVSSTLMVGLFCPAPHTIEFDPGAPPPASDGLVNLALFHLLGREHRASITTTSRERASVLTRTSNTL